MLSVGGGRTGVAPPGGGAPTTYSTSFDSAESPMSEGGKWLHGQTDATIFKDVHTSSGRAHASGFITPETYDDSWAIIKESACTVGPDQQVDATVYLEGGFTPPDTHEIQILLRGSVDGDGPNYFPLYEILFNIGSTTPQLAYQQGFMGGFLALQSEGGPGFASGVAHGDVLHAKIVGTTVTVWKNNDTANYYGGTDNRIADGQPGMGFFVRSGTGADPTKFAWSDWACGPAT
jgi:hypothetical protein